MIWRSASLRNVSRYGTGGTNYGQACDSLEGRSEMKKLMIGLLMVFAVTAAIAETIPKVEIDGLKYSLDTETKTATITGYTGSPTKVDVSEIEYEGQKYTVNAVGDGAFEFCALTEVSLPNVTFIDRSAFWSCSSLASVAVPNAISIGKDAFRETALTEVSLPSATLIGDNAFLDCFSLVSVNLPSATSIGEEAFYDCALTEVSLPSAISIGTLAFGNCSTLSSVVISSATSIGSKAFQGCPSLASIDLPSAISVGDDAFYGCPLTEVSLPNATSIGGGAFRECSVLTSVDLPSAASIGGYAFLGCSKLTSVYFPSATSIGECAFDGCSKLASVDLPSATSIGANAFQYCPLTEVSLPNATSIGRSAFFSCSRLASIDFPSATSIGVNAFKGCSSLASVSLLSALAIGDAAFYGCGALSSLIVNPDMKSAIESRGMETYGLSGSVEITVVEGVVKFVPKDSVVVSKESIAAAKAMTVQVVNGQVALGVSVLSNADITASSANWAPVKFTKDTQIGLSAAGTKLILPVPVAAQQGFMILQSGDAKAVPSDANDRGRFFRVIVIQ